MDAACEPIGAETAENLAGPVKRHRRDLPGTRRDRAEVAEGLRIRGQRALGPCIRLGQEMLMQWIADGGAERFAKSCPGLVGSFSP